MRLLPCLLVLSLCAAPPLAAWGRKGHQIVAALALRDLPPALAPWFRGQEATLHDHCNDPDQWKNRDPQEGFRHFLDSEAYGGPGFVPVAIQDAEARLGQAAFARSGQVPWVVQDRVQDLAQAFRNGDRDQAAYRAAILCHYVGDLSVPLHTTENYNGQLTGQPGVHARWETGLVERLGPWEPEVRTATLDPQTAFAPFQWLKASYALVAPLLRDDLAAGEPGPVDPALETRPSSYWADFNRLQGPKVKEQLALAGQRAAQMILLAWTMAGQPG